MYPGKHHCLAFWGWNQISAIIKDIAILELSKPVQAVISLWQFLSLLDFLKLAGKNKLLASLNRW